VLLLDEPSNHLDVAAIEFLEAFLKQRDMTYIVSSPCCAPHGLFMQSF
jgi:ATPase subunit of ABC transporter with duplicated ATPase domains